MTGIIQKMTKKRMVTNIDKAYEKYLKFCKNHYQFINGTKKIKKLDNNASYRSPKQGYFYLRDSQGWVFAFVDEISGKVFLNQ